MSPAKAVLGAFLADFGRMCIQVFRHSGHPMCGKGKIFMFSNRL